MCHCGRLRRCASVQSTRRLFISSLFIFHSKASRMRRSVAMPLHFGPWLDLTPTFTLRSTYYGAQVDNGSFVDRGFFRTAEEFSMDIRPPSFDRVWGQSGTKWKHVIEPDVVYNYVNGVNDFNRIIRFDEDETLTDTNEIEYGITQRLYRHKDGGDTTA